MGGLIVMVKTFLNNGVDVDGRRVERLNERLYRAFLPDGWHYIKK
jgi:hypothetical protein